MVENAAEATLVRLDRSALDEAKSLLFHAYRHEPTFQYLFDSNRAGYDQRVRATLREGLELHFANGQDAIGITEDDVLVAVAFISCPGSRIALADQFNWRIKMMLTAGLSSTRRFIEYHDQVQAVLPKDLHHHLPFIAVHPKYQSQGYGRMLINAVENICRESPGTCGIGLDTGNERYLSFYLKLGFEKVGEVKIGNVVETVLFKRVN